MPGQFFGTGLITSTAAGSIAGIVGNQDPKLIANRAGAVGLMAGLFVPFGIPVIRAMVNFKSYSK